MQLKSKLHNFKKGSLSIHKYIRSMKRVLYVLLASEQSLREDDLINYVIDGLGPEYDPMVEQILS